MFQEATQKVTQPFIWKLTGTPWLQSKKNHCCKDDGIRPERGTQGKKDKKRAGTSQSHSTRRWVFGCSRRA
jgi:hypothetical protein